MKARFGASLSEVSRETKTQLKQFAFCVTRIWFVGLAAVGSGCVFAVTRHQDLLLVNADQRMSRFCWLPAVSINLLDYVLRGIEARHP